MVRPLYFAAACGAALSMAACAARVTVFDRDGREPDAVADAAPDAGSDAGSDAVADAAPDRGCAFPDDPMQTVIYNVNGDGRVVQAWEIGRNSRLGSRLRPSSSTQPDADLRVPRLALAVDTRVASPTRTPAAVVIADAAGTVHLYVEGRTFPSSAALYDTPIERTTPAGGAAVPLLDALEVRDGRYAVLLRVPPATDGPASTLAEWTSAVYRVEGSLAISDERPVATTVHALNDGVAVAPTFVGPFPAAGPRTRVDFVTGTAQVSALGPALTAPRVISPAAEPGQIAVTALLPTVTQPGALPGLLVHGADLLYTRLEMGSSTAGPAFTRVFAAQTAPRQTLGPIVPLSECSVSSFHSTSVAVQGLPAVLTVSACASASFSPLVATEAYGEGDSLGTSMGAHLIRDTNTVPWAAPRIASNGHEVAVAFVDPSSVGVRLVVYDLASHRRLGTYFLPLPASPRVMAAGIDLIADPASGEWILAALGNNTSIPGTMEPDSYLMRLGRCVTNEPR